MHCVTEEKNGMISVSTKRQEVSL